MVRTKSNKQQRIEQDLELSMRSKKPIGLHCITSKNSLFNILNYNFFCFALKLKYLYAEKFNKASQQKAVVSLGDIKAVHRIRERLLNLV